MVHLHHHKHSSMAQTCFTLQYILFMIFSYNVDSVLRHVHSIKQYCILIAVPGLPDIKNLPNPSKVAYYYNVVTSHTEIRSV